MINELVIKAIRSCNLRCTYCYYIHDETPQYGMQISDESIERLYETFSAYLKRKQEPGALIWHGGEPLMLGRERFEWILKRQQDYFEPGMIQNRMQTNGLLINEAWIDFLLKWDVHVGLSLDGTREAHDRFRVTQGGKGSYDLVVRAIKRLREHGVHVATLTVLSGTDDGRAVLTHMRDELGVRGTDFLLPMSNHAIRRREPDLDAEHAAFLQSAFDAWTEAPNADFKVRMFRSLIRNALGLPHNYIASGASRIDTVVVVETDGSICLDTEFSQIDRYDDGDEYFSGMSVHDSDFSYEDVEDALERLFEEKGFQRVPDDCQTCRMRSVCRGGHPASRYDDTDGTYNHRSAYCEPMYALSERVVDYLVENGYGPHLTDPDLRRVLGLEPDAAGQEEVWAGQGDGASGTVPTASPTTTTSS